MSIDIHKAVEDVGIWSNLISKQPLKYNSSLYRRAAMAAYIYYTSACKHIYATKLILQCSKDR